ncbi:Dolichyl-diphosphooligosaccharide--protein glycosyltransferase subunit 1 [Rhynchospora pubera]|uniref:Dolichyl-diphosphooligosaccharide--protein glycosyltransferase subunit 1 n=2 Tax=Rhynchospora pubera TaxID=906938 RepID=A0AAV8GUJ3_9POAL|nr:Dolichyl-diphosphooligosaccharide--protein glycosyltransferase subunit 1 [Rhynchospora pubera]
MECRLPFSLVVFCLVILSSTVRSELVISSVEKFVDLHSHIVRVVSFLKVENQGPYDVSEFVLAFPDAQAKNLATMLVIYLEEGKIIYSEFPINSTKPKLKQSNMTFYPVTLPKKLEKGKTAGLDVYVVLTNLLKPLPKEITQAESQLLVYTDNIYYTSPYHIRNQSIVFRLPGRIESYSEYSEMRLVESELRYGPFEEQPPFSYSPVVVHFENNNSFAVASNFVQEIEISHWGNVQVTEQYTIIHGGAHLKNGFSRIDYQANPSMSGASSFRTLVARLPPMSHSVYYRDEIGNISTSHLRGDSQGTQLEMELRFPMFGGWKISFSIGYSLPLHDFLFESDAGNNVLNITFGSSIEEIVVENQIVRVVLPQGSKDISVKSRFTTKKSQELKYSHLDIVGRPVVVLEKDNVVPEHKRYFQVYIYYKFNNIFLLGKAMMLILGIFLLFLICILYMHADLALSKTSSWEEETEGRK